MNTPNISGDERFRGRLILAVATGITAGYLFFYQLQPALLGWHPRPVLEREAFLYLVLRTFWLVVLPLLCIMVAMFKPSSKLDAFKIAIIISGFWLIVIPLIDLWVTTPELSGMRRFSYEMFLESGALIIYEMVLSLIASIIVAIVSPLLRLLGRM